MHIFLLFLFPSLAFFICYIQKNAYKTRHLPPGPTPLPIIGNLHLLSPLPHHDILRLSKKYGPILYLRFGSVPTVFISSPALAKEVLKSHDIIFANRPHLEAAQLLSYGYKGLAFTEYGAYWRGARKLCVHHLLNSAKLESYEHIRREEIADFVKCLKEAAKNRAVVDVTAKVKSLVADIMCRIVVGRKCMEESMDGSNFCEHINEVMRLFGTFNLNDFLPPLRKFDIQGVRKRTMKVMEPIDSFLRKIIDEHLKLRDKGKRKNDFVDVMLDAMEDKELEVKFDHTSVKAIIMEMFDGSLDTTTGAIEWALTELIRCPNAMKNLRQELANVVGMGRPVEESDLPKLTYLQMVVKESFRLHPLPFLVHHTKQKTSLDGYEIPQGSNVFVCAWAIGRDPELWPNAEEFIPERFKDKNIEVTGHDYKFLPFGSGRRGCPGMDLGMLIVPLVLAQLVHCFDFELPNGMSSSDLDMTEQYGLTVHRANHLCATPSLRLCDYH